MSDALSSELAAFDAELKALETATASSETKPAPSSTQGPRAPKVISSAPVRASTSATSSAAVATSAPVSGARVPPSQWATPDQITSQLRAEGLIVPQPGLTTPAVPSAAMPPPVPPAPVAAKDLFIESASFQGVRPGYVYKSGLRGVGYYLEGSAADPISSNAQPPGIAVLPSGTSATPPVPASASSSTTRDPKCVGLVEPPIAQGISSLASSPHAKPHAHAACERSTRT